MSSPAAPFVVRRSRAVTVHKRRIVIRPFPYHPPLTRLHLPLTISPCVTRLFHALPPRNTTLPQLDALRAAKLGHIFKGLNCLGRVPWRVNGSVLDVIEQVTGYRSAVCVCVWARALVVALLTMCCLQCACVFVNGSVLDVIEQVTGYCSAVCVRVCVCVCV
jgi:hypothetical protein